MQDDERRQRPRTRSNSEVRLLIAASDEGDQIEESEQWIEMEMARDGRPWKSEEVAAVGAERREECAIKNELLLLVVLVVVFVPWTHVVDPAHLTSWAIFQFPSNVGPLISSSPSADLCSST
jgi:hypothetical protein